MLVTLFCAGMTVIFFIISQVRIAHVERIASSVHVLVHI